MARLPVMAKDATNASMQFAQLATSEGVLITTASQYDAEKPQYVRIKPTIGEAYVQVTPTAITPASGEGAYIDSELSVLVPKGWYIGASAEINVVPWGAPEA